MEEVRKILVIRFSSLGDIVLTTPALHALRRQFPEAEIAFATKGLYADLLSQHPDVDQILPLEGRNLRSTLQYAKDVRGRRFDLVVDLHATPRSRLISSLSGARRRVRYRKAELRRRAMVHGFGGGSRHIHTVDLYLSSLRKLGIQKADRLPSLSVSEENGRFIRGFLASHGVREDEDVVALSPGARWPTKRWPEERFAQVGERLSRESSVRIVLVGSSEDLPSADRVAELMSSTPVVVVGQTSLGQLVALLDRSALLITNDSGPMHVAVARGTPVVAIFGPTHPDLGFAPLGKEDVVFHAGLKCSPCSLHGEKTCRRGRECLDRISVDDVVAAAISILVRR